MASFRPYLHFDGTTRKAMEFYRDALGGELQIQTVGETPWAGDMSQMPGATPDKVMHAALISGDLTIMAADMMDSSSFTHGDTVSLCVVCQTKQEIETLYERLSAGGEVFMPLGQAPFGWYAQFTDQFGVDWMLQSNAA